MAAVTSSFIILHPTITSSRAKRGDVDADVIIGCCWWMLSVVDVLSWAERSEANLA